MDSIKKLRLDGPFIYVPIAFLINAFFHRLAIFTNSKYVFEENRSRSVKFLLFVGVVGLVVLKLIKDKKIEIKIHKDVKRGIRYGCYMLLISALLNSWEDMGDSVKLLLIGSTLSTIVYLSNQN